MPDKGVSFVRKERDEVQEAALQPQRIGKMGFEKDSARPKVRLQVLGVRVADPPNGDESASGDPFSDEIVVQGRPIV